MSSWPVLRSFEHQTFISPLSGSFLYCVSSPCCHFEGRKKLGSELLCEKTKEFPRLAAYSIWGASQTSGARGSHLQLRGSESKAENHVLSDHSASSWKGHWGSQSHGTFCKIVSIHPIWCFLGMSSPWNIPETEEWAARLSPERHQGESQNAYFMPATHTHRWPEPGAGEALRHRSEQLAWGGRDCHTYRKKRSRNTHCCFWSMQTTEQTPLDEITKQNRNFLLNLDGVWLRWNRNLKGVQKESLIIARGTWKQKQRGAKERER